MSTSLAPETVQPVGQDPSPDSTSPESQKAAAKNNISEQTTATITDQHNDPANPQASPQNPQSESEKTSVDTSTLIGPEVTPNGNIDNAQPDLKMPEVNKIDSVLEENVQQVEENKKEVQETPENNPGISKPAEIINESTTSDGRNETVEIEAGKKTEDVKEEEINREPSSDNDNNATQREPESENQQENMDTYTAECINIQELTEHVMNILNDDEVVENVLSEQQLLKKNIDLQQFIVKLIHLLKEKTDLCANLDRQNSALISQAKSLKDVIAITKDLLGIRNMEIEHLHADMAAMEDSIKEERNRHNLSVQRLNEAMTLNDKLKTEYLTQMELFQKLREKYNEKVVYLTRENQRLNGLMNPEAEAVQANTNEMNDQSNQIESVDK